ncbi:MAG: hypothetical protein AAF846_27260 [Chloroflexota bacterium]
MDNARNKQLLDALQSDMTTARLRQILTKNNIMKDELVEIIRQYMKIDELLDDYILNYEKPPQRSPAEMAKYRAYGDDYTPPIDENDTQAIYIDNLLSVIAIWLATKQSMQTLFLGSLIHNNYTYLKKYYFYHDERALWLLVAISEFLVASASNKDIWAHLYEGLSNYNYRKFPIPKEVVDNVLVLYNEDKVYQSGTAYVQIIIVVRRSQDKRFIDRTLEHLSSDRPVMRHFAIELLNEYEDNSILSHVIPLLEDSSEKVRKKAKEVLAKQN